jgi:hypothetical protein
MKQLLLIVALTINFCAYSQDDKTVTLVASGQGKTQDEAKQIALRSAIEQAFGTFISSKTEILNDNLVKDEIISVANGNVQKYDVISEVQIPEGGYATTLKATVSVTKLTSFCESKGVIVEFQGSILAMNVKQQILNESNEIKSIANISSTCKEILDHACDFVIIRGEPKQKNNDNNTWAVPISINVNFNKNIEQFNQYLMQSIRGLCMSSDEVLTYNQLGKNTYKIALGGTSMGGSTPIYHFRTMQTVTFIIDLICYTKHSVFNFEITNGVDTINPEKLIADINSKRWDGYKYVYSKGYGFKIIKDDLTPIFNSRCAFSNYNRTSNGPSGIFGTLGNGDCGQAPSSISEYEPVAEYSNGFYYNGGRSKSFDQIYSTKYGFLVQADKELPVEIIGSNYDKSNKGFQAVISLFDFKPNTNFITYYYEDILSLSDIEKVQGYKINPISKN